LVLTLVCGGGRLRLRRAQGIDDMALKHFVDNGVIAVRRCKKSDLKNLAKATGGMRVRWAHSA
jgi:chaperonin GroEL (HSP60 family)